MKYKFYYAVKDSLNNLPFEIDASNIYEALREFASYFGRHGFKPFYIRTHYFVTNEKGKTSTRVFKTSFEGFLHKEIKTALRSKLETL